MEFFDFSGSAALYIDKERIYSWAGEPLGTLKDDKVHACDGKFVGWVRHGYLINEQGEFCLFTDGAEWKYGPVTPSRQSRPSKRTRQPFPEMVSRMGAPSFKTPTGVIGRNPFQRPSLLRRLFGR